MGNCVAPKTKEKLESKISVEQKASSFESKLTEITTNQGDLTKIITTKFAGSSGCLQALRKKYQATGIILGKGAYGTVALYKERVS